MFINTVVGALSLMYVAIVYVRMCLVL